MEDNKRNKIENLKSQLYSRNYSEDSLARTSFVQPQAEIKPTWQPPGQPLPTPEVKPKDIHSIFKKIFIAAIIFFIVSSSLAIYVFFNGLNIVSKDKVDVTFEGPVSVAAGDELAFDVVISNNNDSTLVNPVLYIDYPTGTKESFDLTQDLIHYKEEVGTILAKSSVRKTVKAVLFGEQLSNKQITAKLEYGLKNSAATYEKESTYSVVISSTPVTMTVSHPQQVASNDDLQFAIDVTSNSTVTLRNLLVKVDYPIGFDVASATPKMTYDATTWLIPTLAPGQKKTFLIQGHVEGGIGDEKIFRVSMGAQSKNNEKQIATTYLSSTESVLLKKPLIAGRLLLDSSSSPDYSVNLGAHINGEVSFTNNISEPITDVEVQVMLDGAIVNHVTPRAVLGFYRSLDNKLLWNKVTQSELKVMNPGDTASVGFSFDILSASQVAAIKNGTMTVSAIVSGKRVSALSADQVISTKLNRIVKIESDVNFSSRVVRAIGPLPTTGPVPPRVNTRTSYTVLWSIGSSANTINGAEVHAKIPTQYVSWLNIISPGNESITWNPEQSEVVWHVGDVPADSSKNSTREVAFQVEILPSISQRGQSPILVKNQTFTGTDSFTNRDISINVGDLTTIFSTDPSFRDGQGNIVQ